MNTYVVFNLFFTAILLLVFLGTIRLLELEKREARTVLFAFAVASVLLSNLYWLAYDILRPGTRMPFAANEIGEWALFLLLGAAVRTQPEVHSAKREVFCAALFTAANVALWIAWSGEWIQDILTGAAFGYFLCMLAAQLRQEEAFPVWEWRLLGVACPVCGADIVLRRTRKGRIYYGCENSPECEFMSWSRPVEEKCPKCGGYMVLRGGKAVCADPACGYKAEK